MSSFPPALGGCTPRHCCPIQHDGMMIQVRVALAHSSRLNDHSVGQLCRSLSPMEGSEGARMVHGCSHFLPCYAICNILTVQFWVTRPRKADHIHLFENESCQMCRPPRITCSDNLIDGCSLILCSVRTSECSTSAVSTSQVHRAYIGSVCSCTYCLLACL